MIRLCCWPLLLVALVLTLPFSVSSKVAPVVRYNDSPPVLFVNGRVLSRVMPDTTSELSSTFSTVNKCIFQVAAVRRRGSQRRICPMSRASTPQRDDEIPRADLAADSQNNPISCLRC